MSAIQHTIADLAPAWCYVLYKATDYELAKIYAVPQEVEAVLVRAGWRVAREDGEALRETGLAWYAVIRVWRGGGAK